MNENSRMYLYIYSILFYVCVCVCLYSIHFLCSRALAIAHAFDWSTINTSFYGFSEMVFLIKLVHFGRYSFLFCALFYTRESALHVYSILYTYIQLMAFSKIYIKQNSRSPSSSSSSSFYNILRGKFPTVMFFFLYFCFLLFEYKNESNRKKSLLRIFHS